jgi:DNA-nicking Smr family endonuclease
MGSKKNKSKEVGEGSSQKQSAKQQGKEDPFFRPFANLPKISNEKQQEKGKEPPKDPSRAPVRPQPVSRPQPTVKGTKPYQQQQQPKHDPDEALTFERFMMGVTPLEDSGKRRIPTSSPDIAPPAKNAKELIAQQALLEQEARERLHALVEEGSRFEVVDDGRTVEGRRRGIDGRLVRRMRHGELPIDATLDLHGMRAEQAREAVEEFVRDRRTKGDRVVVLIHGKGRNSAGGYAVLRGEVSAWLSEGKASTHVAAFVTAPPEQGGEGATCVLLSNTTR